MMTAEALIFLRVDSGLWLSMDQGQEYGASQSALSRLENGALGNAAGQKVLG